MRRLLLLLLATAALADSWMMPKKERYCSAAASYCVDVDPKPIGSPLQYFQDSVDGKPNPGAPPGARKTAIATLLRRNGRDYTPVREFPLLNEVAPVRALVSVDGRYLVTFDNWHSVGWGDTVVVIYRDGKVLKTYGLADLLPKDHVAALPRTSSSIWWGREHRLDEQRGDVVLQIVKKGTETFAENPEYSELRLSLATGGKVRR